MADNIILIIKGFLIGIGKIIPGVSGSLIAITLGVYEKCIDIISNISKLNYKKLIYIIMIGIGVFLSIVLGSRIIIFFIDKNYFLTMSLFIGLILGTIPNVFKNIVIRKKSDLLYVFIPIIIILFIEMISINNKVIINNDLKGFLYTIMLGFIDATTMIIPGISGTAIFVLLGCYEFILELFSNFFSIFTIYFGIGLFLGVILVSKLIDYLFKHYKNKTYLVILGLILSSIIFLIIDLFNNIDTSNIFVSLILFILGFFVSKRLDT